MNVKGIIDGNTNWAVKDVNDDDVTDLISSGSITEDSMNNSMCSISSSELDNDDDQEASSSTSSLSSSSSNSNGPLYKLSELMDHLPLRRGLSMCYEGKAQSFGCLARVESIEDLPKKEKANYRNKVKSCKSFGLCTPKARIAKKSSSSRGACVPVVTRRGSFLGGSRSSFAVQKNFSNSIL
ncbi:oxidative stress [Trifolium repens]|nr:oxidative stress [Trifolium repens]